MALPPMASHMRAAAKGLFSPMFALCIFQLSALPCLLHHGLWLVFQIIEFPPGLTARNSGTCCWKLWKMLRRQGKPLTLSPGEEFRLPWIPRSTMIVACWLLWFRFAHSMELQGPYTNRHLTCCLVQTCLQYGHTPNSDYQLNFLQLLHFWKINFAVAFD